MSVPTRKPLNFKADSKAQAASEEFGNWYGTRCKFGGGGVAPASKGKVGAKKEAKKEPAEQPKKEKKKKGGAKEEKKADPAAEARW